MKCPKCGNELEKEQKYCNICGTPVNQQTSANDRKNKKSGRKLEPRILIPVISGAVCLLIILGVVLFVNPKRTIADQFQEKLDVGDKYLEAGEYKKAEVAFKEALEINEKSPDATMRLADTYNQMGDPDSALRMLNRTNENLENMPESVITSDLDNWRDRMDRYQNIYNQTIDIYQENNDENGASQAQNTIDRFNNIYVYIEVITPAPEKDPTPTPEELFTTELQEGWDDELTPTPMPMEEDDQIEEDGSESAGGSEQITTPTPVPTEMPETELQMETPFIVYLVEEITQEQIDEVGRQIEDREEVLRVEFYPANVAWEEFRQAYFSKAEGQEQTETDTAVINSSNYKVYVKQGTDEDELAEYLQSLELVLQVILPSENTSTSLEGEEVEAYQDGNSSADTGEILEPEPDPDTEEWEIIDPVETEPSADENGDGIPTEEFPAEELPTEELPTEEFPVEELPTEEFPAEEIPVQTVSPDQLLDAYAAEFLSANPRVNLSTPISYTCGDDSSMGAVNGVLGIEKRDFNGDGTQELLVVSVSGGQLVLDTYVVTNDTVTSAAVQIGSGEGFGRAIEGVTYGGTQECFLKDNGTSVDIGIASHYFGMDTGDGNPSAKTTVVLYKMGPDGMLNMAASASLVNGSVSSPQEGGKDAFAAALAAGGLSGAWISESADVLSGMDLVNNPFQDLAGVPNPLSSGLAGKEPGVQDLVMVNAGMQPGSGTMNFSVTDNSTCGK